MAGASGIAFRVKDIPANAGTTQSSSSGEGEIAFAVNEPAGGSRKVRVPWPCTAQAQGFALWQQPWEESFAGGRWHG